MPDCQHQSDGKVYTNPLRLKCTKCKRYFQPKPIAESERKQHAHRH
jgi:hypothetical protein